MQGGDTGVHQDVLIDFGMKNVESVVIKQQTFTAKNACPGATKYFWRRFLGLIFFSK